MDEIESTIELGDVARDQVTGFQGVVIAITYWMNGCARPMLMPQVLDEGKLPQAESFDIGQLLLVQKGAVVPGELVAKAEGKPGGPRPNPKPF